VDLHHQLFAGFTGAPEFKTFGFPASYDRNGRTAQPASRA
jgi:hypothetical protein